MFPWKFLETWDSFHVPWRVQLTIRVDCFRSELVQVSERFRLNMPSQPSFGFHLYMRSWAHCTVDLIKLRVRDIGCWCPSSYIFFLASSSRPSIEILLIWLRCVWETRDIIDLAPTVLVKAIEWRVQWKVVAAFTTLYDNTNSNTVCDFVRNPLNILNHVLSTVFCCKGDGMNTCIVKYMNLVLITSAAVC